jgi:hypothetical protein
MSTIKIIIAVAFLVNAVNSFDCNMFPIIRKLFGKNTCYCKYNKNYVSYSHTIRNHRTIKNHYKMTDANINRRNSTYVSKEIDDFSKYLGNTAPRSNN